MEKLQLHNIVNSSNVNLQAFKDKGAILSPRNVIVPSWEVGFHRSVTVVTDCRIETNSEKNA